VCPVCGRVLEGDAALGAGPGEKRDLMHVFDVTLSTLQRRNRAAFVPADAELDLWPGEKVVLRDQDGEYYAGTVVGPVEDPEPRVHIHVGVRMPEEYAVLRIERERHLDDLLASFLDGELDESEDALDDEIEVCGPAMVGDVQQLLDLLGDARETLAGRSARRLVRQDIADEVARTGTAVVAQMPPQRLA
jgi:hypothetical protein